jgi:transposase-like protein
MKKSSYTREFKLEAVRLLESGTRGGSEIAMELGIRRNQLYKWQQEIELKGTETAFPGKGSRKNVSNEADENARLKRELARVKEERDILKKAITFITRE